MRSASNASTEPPPAGAGLHFLTNCYCSRAPSNHDLPYRCSLPTLSLPSVEIAYPVNRLHDFVSHLVVAG